MDVVERQAVIRRWVLPSSDHEKEKQDRALRMVKSAIDGWPAFKGVSYRIYAKGSYANNTNVRLDSDVDIAVQGGGGCGVFVKYKDVHRFPFGIGPLLTPWCLFNIWRNPRKCKGLFSRKVRAELPAVPTEHKVPSDIRQPPGI